MKNESNKFSLFSLVNIINESELNEIQPTAAEDALATFRNIGKGTKAAQQVAQDIVATMSRGGQAGEAIHIIGKGNNLVPVKNGSELLNALKAGTIDAVNLARVNKGILKSGAVRDINVLRNIASDVVYETGFVKKYGAEYLGKGEDAARKLLQDNGYSRNAIDEMIKKMKADANYGKNVAGLEQDIAKLKSQNKTLRGKTKKQNQQGQSVEIEAKTDGNGVKPTQDGGVQITEPVPSGGTPKPPVNVSSSKIKELIDGIKNKKWNWKKIIAWGAGIGLSMWALWWIISKLSDTVPTDMPKVEPEVGNEWAPCIQELVKSGEGKLMTLSDGLVVVRVVTPEYPEGLNFVSNGRVADIATKKMGSWKCKGGKMTIQEQVDDDMSSDVETMVDLLDFPVTQNNLISAGTLLKKYVDNGKGKEFLSLYQDTGYGSGDLSKTLDYIVTTQAKSVQAKRYLRELVKQIESGTSTTNTTTGEKIGLKNIDITWDGEKNNNDKPNPVTSKYHNCNNKELPHEFGCRSNQIKQVQICLGLPEKYQTGNFGPITKKALEDKGIDTSNGLTQSIVDSVCKDDNGSVRKREQIKLEPLAPRDIKLKPIDVSNLKLPNIKPLEVTPSQFYNALRDNGNIKGEDGNNRIKYKGPDLDDTQLGRLDSALSDMGYTRIKQLEDVKRYGSKYVWLKQ